MVKKSKIFWMSVQDLTIGMVNQCRGELNDPSRDRSASLTHLSDPSKQLSKSKRTIVDSVYCNRSKGTKRASTLARSSARSPCNIKTKFSWQRYLHLCPNNCMPIAEAYS